TTGSNQVTLRLTDPSDTFIDGSYTLRIVGAGAGAVADEAGNRLDGNTFAGYNGGDDEVVTFDVDTVPATMTLTTLGVTPGARNQDAYGALPHERVNTALPTFTGRVTDPNPGRVANLLVELDVD